MSPRRKRSGRGRGGGEGKPSRDRVVDLDRYRSIIPDWADFQSAAGRPEPTVFRVRTGRITEEALVERLHGQGFRTRSLDGLPGFFQVEEGPRPVSMTLEHWLGLIYVQQASTGVAAPQLGPAPGERVLDMCAAPGGKTTHMAELMHDSGCLVASEISEPRIRGLLGNVYRLGHPNIFVVSGDAREFPVGAHFDRVLLDAPCSGEGTLRRRGGQAPNQSRSFLGYVTRAQRELLERAVTLTKPGGTILYVTCTFAPEENEAVVSDALARLPVELDPLTLPVPHAPGLTSFEGTRFDPRLEGAARIYPQHLDSGGLFLAKLRRLDDGGSLAAAGSGRSEAVGEVFSEASRGASAAASGLASGEDAQPTRGSAAWSPVPSLFPGDTVDEEEVLTRVQGGIAEIQDRFGTDGALDEVRWVMRGGRAWLHTVDAWPMQSWVEGAWRPISIGFRAIDFDSQGRARPTNDLLRWLGSRVTARVEDLGAENLGALARRETVATDIDRRGPIALRFQGDLLGRGAVTVDGLKSEIPKARANDLARILALEASD